MPLSLTVSTTYSPATKEVGKGTGFRLSSVGGDFGAEKKASPWVDEVRPGVKPKGLTP